MKRLTTIGVWIVQVGMAVVMVGPGLQKFTSPVWQRMFHAWGYPEHCYLVIGGIEVVAGLGLLVPRLASPSAIVLAVVMVGAGLTQRIQGGRSGVGEALFAVLLVLIAYARWPGVLARLARRPGGAAPAAATPELPPNA